MAVHQDYLGLNEDGSPRFHVWSDDPNAHLLLTGPIFGTVEVDGKTVDVSAPFIEVESHEQALAISDKIGQRHAEQGHPDHDADKPFVHTPAALTHESDGTQKEKFVAAVMAAVPASADSSPQGVIDALTTKKKG